MSSATGWELVAEQRRALADEIAGLSDEQVATASLCGSWNVHQVAAHVTSFVAVPFPRFMANIAKNRFDYDKASDGMARKLASEQSIGELAATLRERATKKPALPMFPPELTLSDLTIHRQDIRRPVNGEPGEIDEQQLRTVLDFLAGNKKAKPIVAPSVVDGLQLRATDLDWTHGSGPEVAGAGEAVMLAISGRSVLDELSGDGVDELRSRF